MFGKKDKTICTKCGSNKVVNIEGKPMDYYCGKCKSFFSLEPLPPVPPPPQPQKLIPSEEEEEEEELVQQQVTGEVVYCMYCGDPIAGIHLLKQHLVEKHIRLTVG